MDVLRRTVDVKYNFFMFIVCKIFYVVDV